MVLDQKLDQTSHLGNKKESRWTLTIAFEIREGTFPYSPSGSTYLSAQVDAAGRRFFRFWHDWVVLKTIWNLENPIKAEVGIA